jgi:hypothetical protein
VVVAAKEDKVNIAQATNIGAQVFSCANSNTFQDIPDLALSLETKGRPVAVSFTVIVGLAPLGAIVDLHPVIDGNPPPDRTFVHDNNGANEGTIHTLSYSQVFLLDKGPHTFGVQFRCPGSGQVQLTQRWHTVYELGD